MEVVLSGLRAAAESTRLRLLALCAHGDLTVSDLVRILGISQPRVSRHLKVMCESGLLERIREGAWVFYRLAPQGVGAEVARSIVGMLPESDPELALDRERLATIRAARAVEAAAYFRANAAHWDDLRGLFGSDRPVEEALRGYFIDRPLEDFLDIGTGTGRILDVMSPHAERCVGIDQSREMLAVARANLERAGVRNGHVRQGDMYALPFAAASFDGIVIHQVLHFAEDPAAVIAEAARVLRPGGRLAIADLAPHQREELREEHNHRRLGFSAGEITGWCAGVGLVARDCLDLAGRELVVRLWVADRPPVATPALRSESAPSVSSSHAAFDQGSSPS
ncbi:ArsR/SmtB family transcription factor [Rhodospirillum rubrum]|uniref:Transcriptional regulator, ArsR family n=1 Tax=Rhodospirillum rubrum (strain ATCC 11170 / ATH 1.1.1 / DSM 467 / LMG 4362 / NCIMB 8255 / S1) TaxID=269796 RepID=Q2RU66_RHORT|nr:metalloregulator ArsR/SmtB family transcription factor [Rhodospirillum rubrum]ABC22329.1 transcriptional regulator, ArsR family [Rhodospirillum rubrum ATCC 11170]MBK5953909.1 ArsR family transcriptional regulator [Rhodospirillum rubrum]QXG81969.1 metalloregulator ArsR/SmtB family transcription factor [Rhodospirillum rubrum]HCF16856.1 methyltransferase domain-containing protein [Rhodospirillum rubrum]